MKFLFKYATRERPDRFFTNLAAYYSLLSHRHDYQFLVTIDQDDPTMNNCEVLNNLHGWPDLITCINPNRGKICAINYGMDQASDWDILIVVSDDMKPIVLYFDDLMANAMQKHYPKLGGALHYHDGKYGQDKCITLSVMGKALYDHFGYIYHPDYLSVFCDNEFTDEVYRMNCVKFYRNILIMHDWIGESEPDELHRINEALSAKDHETYNKRKALKFPKESIF